MATGDIDSNKYGAMIGTFFEICLNIIFLNQRVLFINYQELYLYLRPHMSDLEPVKEKVDGHGIKEALAWVEKKKVYEVAWVIDNLFFDF